MGFFDSDETIHTRVNAEMAYDKSQSNSEELSNLKDRLAKLEKYIGVEWSRSNSKYYIVAPKPVSQESERGSDE